MQELLEGMKSLGADVKTELDSEDGNEGLIERNLCRVIDVCEVCFKSNLNETELEGILNSIVSLIVLVS